MIIIATTQHMLPLHVHMPFPTKLTPLRLKFASDQLRHGSGGWSMPWRCFGTVNHRLPPTFRSPSGPPPAQQIDEIGAMKTTTKNYDRMVASHVVFPGHEVLLTVKAKFDDSILSHLGLFLQGWHRKGPALTAVLV